MLSKPVFSSWAQVGLHGLSAGPLLVSIGGNDGELLFMCCGPFT